MKFTYETQGAITYLVCEMDTAEQIDSLTLGMLTNNHIAGLAPVLYTEMNGQKYLKYNISAKVSADQFFSGSMNKQRALTAFQNILSAICSADEYMIDQNCFSVAAEHIFLNVSSCETALICIPVTSDKDINADMAALFKKIMFSTQFDNSEDASYITQLITYINSGASFSVYGLKDLVSKLQSGVYTSIPTPSPAPSVQPQVNVPPVQQPVTHMAPASSFDSTISIDDMPAMIAQKQAQSMQPAPQMPSPVQTARPQTPVTPSVPPVRPVQPQVPPQTMPPMGRPINNINNGAPDQNNKAPQSMVKPQQPPVQQKPPVMQKPPVQNGPGFAIPGQPMGGVAKPQSTPAPVQKQQSKVEATGEKKMSFLGLLSHYNKENAELYKKQKEAAKAKKTAESAKPVQKSVQPPVGAIPGGIPGQQPPIQRPPMETPAQQQFTPPQYQPPVQPVPVQNSFNETTVLTPAMMGGETTVLSVNPTLPNPTLTRAKTGEKISINKPVFRIGKEKSYVDYFIADNTAISRSHANIHTENGEYFIEDTNSTNHTYINGKLINSNVKTKLVSGDKVRLANEDFTFSV